MKPLRAKFARLAVGLLTVVLLALTAVSLSAPAGQPLGKVNLESFDFTPADGFAVLRLTGTAEGLGKCIAYAELDVVYGEAHTYDGTGVVAFTSANGDMLVGVITAQRDSEGATSAEVHWRDRVTLHDGTTVASTGRFENQRPAGLRISHCCRDCYRPASGGCVCIACCN